MKAHRRPCARLRNAGSQAAASVLTHGLVEIDGIKRVVHATIGVSRALTFGWGMKHDEIPKYCKFGKNTLLLSDYIIKIPYQ